MGEIESKITNYAAGINLHYTAVSKGFRSKLRIRPTKYSRIWRGFHDWQILWAILCNDFRFVLFYVNLDRFNWQLRTARQLQLTEMNAEDIIFGNIWISLQKLSWIINYLTRLKNLNINQSLSLFLKRFGKVRKVSVPLGSSIKVSLYKTVNRCGPSQFFGVEENPINDSKRRFRQSPFYIS